MQTNLPDTETLKTALLEGKAAEAMGLTKQDMELAFRLAREAFEKENFDLCLRHCLIIVSLDPGEPAYQTLLAETALELEAFELALSSASALIMMNPKNHIAYLISGQACIGMEHRDEAVEDLNDAMSLAKEAHDGATFKTCKKLLEQL